MKCLVCKLDKPAEDFHRGNRACKSCRKIINARSYRKRKAQGKFDTPKFRQDKKEANQRTYCRHLESRRARARDNYAKCPDLYSRRSAQWRAQNKERKAKMDRQYRLNNKDQIKVRDTIYKNSRRKTDTSYRLSMQLRSRLGQAIRREFKGGSAVRDLGCTIEELKKHLESRFQPGMSWENWGICGWHIDHVRPLSSFDLEDRQQFLVACHYTNLQPLWHEDNIRKGARYAGT